MASKGQYATKDAYIAAAVGSGVDPGMAREMADKREGEGWFYSAAPPLEAFKAGMADESPKKPAIDAVEKPVETVDKSTPPIWFTPEPATRAAGAVTAHSSVEDAEATTELRHNLVSHYMRQNPHWSESMAQAKAEERMVLGEQSPPERAVGKREERPAGVPFSPYDALGDVWAPRIIEEGRDTSRTARLEGGRKTDLKYEDVDFGTAAKMVWEGPNPILTEEEAAQSGLAGKYWSDKLSYAATTFGKAAPLAGLSFIDTISTGLFGYDVPVLTSGQELYQAGQKGLEGLQGYGESKEAQAATNVEDLAKLAARFSATQLSGLTETLGLVDEEKAQAFRALVNPSENMKAFMAERKQLKEQGASKDDLDSAASESILQMSPSQFPYMVEAKSPTVDDMRAYFKKNPAGKEMPQFGELLLAIDQNDDARANDVLRRMRYGALPPEMQEAYMPPIDRVVGVSNDIQAYMQETGTKAGEGLEGLFNAFVYDKDKETGKYVEGTLGRLTRALMTLPEVVYEQNLPLPTPAYTYTWLVDGLAPESVRDKIVPDWIRAASEARIGFAGVEHMLTSETLGPMIKETLGITHYEPTRDLGTSAMARVLSNIDTGYGGGALHARDILIQGGADEDSRWVNLATFTGNAIDMLLPFEETFLGAGAAPLRATSRAIAGAKMARPGTKSAYAAASAFPTLYAAKLGSKDTDIFTVHGALTGSLIQQAVAKGVDPLTVVPESYLKQIAEVLDLIAEGGSEAVFEAVRKSTNEQKAQFLLRFNDTLLNGTPETQALRKTQSYRNFAVGMEHLVTAGRITEAQKPMVMAYFEHLAFKHAAMSNAPGPNIPTPEAYLDLVRARVGRADRPPGPEALLQEETATIPIRKAPVVEPAVELTPEEIEALLKEHRYFTLPDPGGPPVFMDLREIPFASIPGGKIASDFRKAVEASVADRTSSPEVRETLQEMARMGGGSGDIDLASADLFEKMTGVPYSGTKLHDVDIEALLRSWGVTDEIKARHQADLLEAQGEVALGSATVAKYSDILPGNRLIDSAPHPDDLDLSGGMDPYQAEALLHAMEDGSIKAASADITYPMGGLERVDLDGIEEVIRASGLKATVDRTRGLIRIEQSTDISPIIHLGMVKELQAAISNIVTEAPFPEAALRFAKQKGIPAEELKRTPKIRWYTRDTTKPIEGEQGGLYQTFRRGLEAFRRRQDEGRRFWERAGFDRPEVPGEERPVPAYRGREGGEPAGQAGMAEEGPVGASRVGAGPPSESGVLEEPGWPEALGGRGVEVEPAGKTLDEFLPSGEGKLYERVGGTIRGSFERVAEKNAKFLIQIFETGDLDTMWHEAGHFVEALMGKDWYTKVSKHVDHEILPDGNVKLTVDGQEELAEAHQWWMKTRYVPGGMLQRHFGDLYTSMQDLWHRMRGGRFSPEMRDLFDAYYRPQDIAKDTAIKIAFDARKAFPTVMLDATKVEDKVAKAGRAREASRIDTNLEAVLDAMGIKKNTAEMDSIEMFSRAASHVAAERARKAFGGTELKRLTPRTVVPISRVPRILAETRDRLLKLKIVPEELKIDRIDDVDTVLFTKREGAGFKVLVDELANEALGNALPAELVDSLDGPRWESVSLKEYNQVLAVLMDTRAGLGSRRSRLGEAVAPTTAHAAIKTAVSALKFMERKAGAAGMIDKAQNAANRLFTVEPVGKGAIDPGAAEILDAKRRELRMAGDWMSRTGRALKKDAPMAAFKDLLDGIRRTLTPPIPVGGTRVFERLYNKFSLAAGEALEKNSVQAWTAGEMSSLKGILLYGDRMSDAEDTAMQFLQDYVGSGRNKGFGGDAPEDPLELALLEDDVVKLEQALKHIDLGLKRRAQALESRVDRLIIAFSGGTSNESMKTVLEATFDDKMKFYRLFYSPKTGSAMRPVVPGSITEISGWDHVWKWMSDHGFQTQPERLGHFDRNLAYIHALHSMRVMDIMSGLAEDLARYGLMVDIPKGAKQFGVDVKDPNKFIDMVTHYLDLEGAFGNVIAKQEVEFLREGDQIEAKTVVSTAPPGLGRKSAISDKGQFKWTVHGEEGMEAYLIASKLMGQWGMKSGLGSWVRTVLPDGSEVLMPKLVRDELTATLDNLTILGGAYRSTEPTGMVGKAIDTILRLNPLTMSKIRMGLTTGILLPNPAHYTAQVVGGAFQVFQGAGPVAAAKAVGLLPLQALGVVAGRLGVGQPGLTGAVVARLYGDGTYKMSAKPIVTRSGQIYTADTLAELAHKEGLRGSFVHAETAATFANELKLLEPGFWDKMVGKTGLESKTGWNIVQGATPANIARWWQKQLVEGVTGIDNYYRVGVFIDAIKRGDTPTSAAELARTIGYDYTALTEFERKVMRNTFMFYSYMRKNMDLFWYTLLRHPSRIAGQLRLIHGIHQAYMEEEPELTLKEWQKDRLPVWIRKVGSTSHLEPGTSPHPNSHVVNETMWVAPPLPAMDALGFWIDLFEIASTGGRDKKASGQMVSKLTPIIRGPLELHFGEEAFSGKEIDNYNRIPPWMVQVDRALTGGILVDDVLASQEQNDHDYSRQDVAGARWFHAQNAPAWYVVKNLIQYPGFGRSMDTLTALDRANVALNPFDAVVAGIGEFGVRASTQGVGLGDMKFYLTNEGWSGRQSDTPLDLPRKPGEDTIEPRPGLSGVDEMLGLFGFKPWDTQSEPAFWERAHAEQTSRKKEASSKLKRGEFSRGMGESPYP